MVFESIMIDRLLHHLPSVLLGWAVLFVLSCLLIWTVPKLAWKAGILSLAFSLAFLLSWTFQGASEPGHWTRWSLFVLYILVARLVVGSRQQIEGRRRENSISRRR